MNNKKNKWIIWLIIVVVFIINIVLLNLLPYGDNVIHVEEWLSEYSIGFAIIVANLYLWIPYVSKKKHNVLHCTLVILLAAIVCFGASRRVYEFEKINLEFTGTVVEKYQSDNHGALSIRLAQYPNLKIEGVDREFWSKVKEGDLLKKEKNSIFAEINTKQKIFILKDLLNKKRGKNLKIVKNSKPN